jgi:hypothetical protein
LKELWSDRLIEILIPNAPKLHFGQGLLHGDLERLDYNLGPMVVVPESRGGGGTRLKFVDGGSASPPVSRQPASGK